MVGEATAHEADDKVRREQVERRNRLDNLCYTVEKTLQSSKDKLPTSDVALLESLVKEGREAGELQDDARVRGAIEKLEKEAHRVSSAAYQGAGAGTETGGAAAPEPATGAPSSSKGPKAGVVDAEFEEAS